MRLITLVLVALVAILSSLAAPTDPPFLPAILQLPQIPLPALPTPIPVANLNNLDDQARAQARAILDEVVSRYPTLIDSFASLLNAQTLLSPDSLLQNSRGSNFGQSSALLPLPQLPKLSDIVPSLPGLPSLPSMPGFPGTGTQGVDATSPLSSAADVVLSNLRDFASAPLQFAPIPPPFATLVDNTPGIFPTRGLQLPNAMVPLILTFPDEQGLSPDELAESIKRRIGNQDLTSSDGSLDAWVSVDPLALMRVLDIQPLPRRGNKVKADSRKPIRRIVPGPFSTGNTEVQIYLDVPDFNTEPAEEKTDDVRIGMSNIDSNSLPDVKFSRERTQSSLYS